MKKMFALFLAFFLYGLLRAQISNVVLTTERPTQYEKTDWDIQLIQQWTNPFLQEDIALDMTILSPSAKKLSLPCYYSSGESEKASTWKARFAPQEMGTYNCSFIIKKKGKVVGTSKQYQIIVKPSDKDGILHLKSNWTFQFDSGKPFRGLGENIGWESRANDDSKFFKELHEKPKYNYEYMLKSLASHGGNFFRTWISSFNLPIDWKKGFNSTRYQVTSEYLNPSAIAKMDRLVNLCDSLQLYMMLTLGQGAYHTRDGGYAASAADFFVNPLAKAQYKNRLRYFVARWGYSSSIAAWEFFNEVDNVQFSNKTNPISADSIVAWHDEMSRYLKQIDPYQHLVTTSISHRDLKGLNSLANIDFNQKHIYRNTGGIPETIVKYTEAHNKPYVIGEYSYEWDWSKNFNDFGKEMDSDFKRGLWYGLFSPTPILPLSWWWEYFDDRSTDAYFSKVKTISDRMLQAGNGSFESVALVSPQPALKMQGVMCGDETYVYTYNPAATNSNISFEVPFGSAAYKVETYDCETGKYNELHKASLSNNKITISDFDLPGESDVVFVISAIKKP